MKYCGREINVWDVYVYPITAAPNCKPNYVQITEILNGGPLEPSPMILYRNVDNPVDQSSQLSFNVQILDVDRFLQYYSPYKPEEPEKPEEEIIVVKIENPLDRMEM